MKNSVSETIIYESHADHAWLFFPSILCDALEGSTLKSDVMQPKKRKAFTMTIFQGSGGNYTVTGKTKMCYDPYKLHL